MANYVENFSSVFVESGDDVYAKPVVSGNVVLSPWPDDSVAALEIGTTNTYAITLDETKAYVAYLNLTTQTFTADAGTDVITATAHGLLAGETIRFKGTDLPAGITQSTLYYIISPTANTFQISATPGGSAVNITDAGSGTMLFNAPSKRTSTDLVIGSFSIIKESVLTPEGEASMIAAMISSDALMARIKSN